MTTYEEALANGHEIGASRASESEVMALFCESGLQLAVGAVSPKLVWEGAQKKGLTLKEFTSMCASDPIAVSELMWL